MQVIALKLIRAYQQLISPLLGQHCRFYPTCSQYCFEAIQKYGLLRGCWKGLTRILRCRPGNIGGIDLP